MSDNEKIRVNPNISEAKFFNAPSKNRDNFRKKFLKKATKKPSLNLPLDVFDLNDGRKNGLERLKRTKERIIASNTEIEFLMKQKTFDSEEWKLYRQKNHENLLRIRLIETAHAIQTSPSRAKRLEFNRLNSQLYGTVNRKLFNRLISTKKCIIQNFKPVDEIGKNYKSHLLKSMPFKLFYYPTFRTKEPSAVFSKIHELLLKNYPVIFETLKDDKKIYDAEEAKIVLQHFIDVLGFDWQVIISDKVSIVTDSVTDHSLKLPKDFSRTGRELKRLAIHEIGVHTARAVYGKRNGGPLLEYGTAMYLRAEEGLATLCECSVEESFDNESYQRIVYRYLTAGLALGVDGKKRNAVEVFNIIAPMIAIEKSKDGKITDEIINDASDLAYRHIENAFRGTDWITRGCVFLKLKIYYEGLLKNIEYFSKNLDHADDAFRLAMLGKYDHTDIKSCKDALFLISTKK